MSSTESLQRDLRGVAIFAGLPDDAIRELAAGSRLRRYPRGQLVFTSGDPGDSLLVVRSGRIKVVVRSADGGELMLTVVGLNGVLGELNVVDGGSRSADAETLEPSEVVIVGREAVLALTERVPLLTTNLLRSVAASLRRLTDATADLVFLDLPRRVAKLLLDQSRSPDGTVDLGMSQEEVAHRVGGTRQSVNAALHGFQRRGWVALRGRQVAILDVEALAGFAGR